MLYETRVIRIDLPGAPECVYCLFTIRGTTYTWARAVGNLSDELLHLDMGFAFEKVLRDATTAPTLPASQ